MALRRVPRRCAEGSEEGDVDEGPPGFRWAVDPTVCKPWHPWNTYKHDLEMFTSHEAAVEAQESACT